ncbi:hypothetical protein F0249_20120 [Vibrio sp. 03-59-1]|uniref:hypothetical protein n=1 Tax=Vibrio sp. 03-59-1 TaxID=2607607 RepID=UPI0014938B22|nr:hypothetical protein [Vibrio sp. 03-59-1]NOH86076.1 hypothetical protein [Vibrio sp. 03-59-1]
MTISRDELISQLQDALNAAESAEENDTIEITIGDADITMVVEESVSDEDEDENEDEDEELVPNKYGELFDSNGDFVGHHPDWIGGPEDNE